MKILICGATGYVGSRLTKKLLDEGHQIRCLARNPDSLNERFNSQKLEVIHGNLLNQETLHHIFDEVVTFNDTGVHKPGKEPFMLMIDRLKIDSKDCLMVGDWPDRDIKGAKQFGMKTAFAKYGNSENIAHSDADYDLEHFSDLLDIIKKENN